MDDTESQHCIVREIAHILAKAILRLACHEEFHAEDSRQNSESAYHRP